MLVQSHIGPAVGVRLPLMMDRRYLLYGLAGVCCIGLAVMTGLMIARSSVRNSPRASLSGTTGLPQAKILQFYATQPMIMRGGQTSLCYGVEKAVSVRIDPELPNSLDPVAFRCFLINPDQTTQYELTATGADGRDVSKAVSVMVQ